MLQHAEFAGHGTNSPAIPAGLIMAICLFGQSTSAGAHHSTATMYDPEGDIEIAGEVTDVRWNNPHVRLTLQVTEGGNTSNWMLEGADSSSMHMRGVPVGLIQVGDSIRVGGHPSRRGRNEIWTTNILLEDGREILVYPRVAARWTDNTIGTPHLSESLTENAQRRDDASSGIFGVWLSYPGFNGGDQGGIWGGDIELTAEAAAVRDQYDPAGDDNPFLSCTRGIPEIMAGLGPLEFIDQGDRIQFRFEEFDIVRSILMGSDAEANRPPESAATAYGDVGYSVGHWENDKTLTVRTTGMNFPFYDQTGLRQSPDAEIVERWSLTDGGNALEYELTVIDSATFVRPVVQSKTWHWAPERTVQPYDCVEER